MHALTFSRFGGPEVLEYREMPDPVLKANEILMAPSAIGLNFSDLERRLGSYHLAGSAPYIAGYEAAGVVVDANHHPEFKVGDRIAFTDVPFANATRVAVPTSHVIPLHAEVEFVTAAAILLQGLTAQYLVHDSHAVLPGETIVVHAAAGGVGQFLTQFCVLKGARVIGLTTSDSKLPLITARGAALALNLKSDWKKAVTEFTGGKGVDVVYDSIGTTLPDSFAVTRTGGTVITYGMSGGTPALIDPRMLMDTSKTLTGGDLWGYLTSREERVIRANALFEWIASGRLTLPEVVTFPLSEGRKAHEQLAGGKNAGKIVMTV